MSRRVEDVLGRNIVPKEYWDAADQVINLAKRVLPREFGKIEKPRWELTIGGKSPAELERMLDNGRFPISRYAREMLHNSEFTTLKRPEKVGLVVHTPEDLGFTGIATTEQIYRKAQEQYDLCPAEAAIFLRMAYRDQPEGEWLVTGMKQILDSDGRPDVFALARDGGRLWLSYRWANPDPRWPPANGFVFSLRK